MNLKQRFSIIFSALFSIVLALMMIILLSLFEQFRQDEFKQRLQNKAVTTVKLLIDIEETDKKLLRILNNNTANNLYNEKIIILDDSSKILYNSAGKEIFKIDKKDLNVIKNKTELYKQDGDEEVYGYYISSRNGAYYSIIKAEDKYGFRKLKYLRYLLIGSYIISNILVWGLSFYLSKISLGPLDNVTNKIKEITEKNLNVRLEESNNKDEIRALTSSFNQMLDRIEKSYKKQKEFTSNASHELRTPISRIIAQLENLILQNKNLDTHFIQNLKSISDDTYQLSELVSSLLILSKIEDVDKVKFIKSVRLDEIIFNGSSLLSDNFTDYKLHFSIQAQEGTDINLEIAADESLLKIALLNLLKNAYLYSNDGNVFCAITSKQKGIEISIKNNGIVPNVKDTEELFQSFYRGSNSANKSGSGLGLGITKRIVQYHGGTISFNRPDGNTNLVKVEFPLNTDRV